MIRTSLFLSVLCLLAACRPQGPAVNFEDLSESERRLPENATVGLEPAQGLEVALFASEPMLINPTNLHVDERGRVWVCEALNYRNTHNPENPYREEGDRILILEDSDGDGKADKRSVFYQGTDVNAALGIWAAGSMAVVSCSPNVFVLTDTDGDNQADRKDTLFTGLGGLQSDHAVHAFVVGPDGRYYFNFGNSGSQIRDKNGKLVFDPVESRPSPQSPPYRQGMIFRCNADGSGLEVLAHNFRNNYEVALDSYGNMWQSDNDDDGNQGVRINYVMEYGNYGYTDEMTGAWWGERRVNMEADIPSRHWHQNDPGVVPNLLPTGSGSPCGMAIYEGDLLPEVFRGQILHAEAGHNVVRAYRTTPDGYGYKAEIVNLLKGKDQWFRPSDVCVAPDGSVFVADWYDPAVGGHKFGDPERGRIYRIAPNAKKYKPQQADLQSTSGAIKALASPNLSVQALAADRLRKMGAEAEQALAGVWNKGANERLRARALWILARLPGAGDRYIEEALRDDNEEMAAAALRVARQVSSKPIVEWIERIGYNSAAQCREAAIALRFQKGGKADSLWAKLATGNSLSRWNTEALGIGADLSASSRFGAWLKAIGDPLADTKSRELIWRSRAPEALPYLVKIIMQVESKEAPRYLRAFDFHHATPQKNEALASLLALDKPGWDTIQPLVMLQIDAAFASRNAAIRRQLENMLPRLKGTMTYLDLIAKFQIKSQNAGLLELMKTHTSPELRSRAAGLLAQNGGMGLALNALKNADENLKLQLLSALGPVFDPALVKLYQQYLGDKQLSLPLRRAALNGLNSTWDGQIYLMELATQKRIPEELRAQALLALAGAWNTDVRQKARAILAQEEKEAGNVLPPIAVLEGRSGNAAAGRPVFEQQCAICHQIEQKGVNFGPALTEIGSKLGKDALYQAILYPSSGINYGYEGYNLKLKDGTLLQGIIESRTGTQLSLRLPNGSSRQYALADIESMEELPQSLMPAGFHRSLSEQQLVDLIEYLATLKAEGS